MRSLIGMSIPFDCGYDDQAASLFLEVLNSFRKEYGNEPWEYDAELSKLAAAQLTDLLNYSDNERPRYYSFDDKMECGTAANYGYIRYIVDGTSGLTANTSYLFLDENLHKEIFYTNFLGKWTYEKIGFAFESRHNIGFYCIFITR